MYARSGDRQELVGGRNKKRCVRQLWAVIVGARIFHHVITLGGTHGVRKSHHGHLFTLPPRIQPSNRYRSIIIIPNLLYNGGA